MNLQAPPYNGESSWHNIRQCHTTAPGPHCPQYSGCTYTGSSPPSCHKCFPTGLCCPIHSAADLYRRCCLPTSVHGCLPTGAHCRRLPMGLCCPKQHSSHRREQKHLCLCPQQHHRAHSAPFLCPQLHFVPLQAQKYPLLSPQQHRRAHPVPLLCPQHHFAPPRAHHRHLLCPQLRHRAHHRPLLCPSPGAARQCIPPGQHTQHCQPHTIWRNPPCSGICPLWPCT